MLSIQCSVFGVYFKKKLKNGNKLGTVICKRENSINETGVFLLCEMRMESSLYRLLRVRMIMIFSFKKHGYDAACAGEIS